jgi:hypothetical protein
MLKKHIKTKILISLIVATTSLCILSTVFAEIASEDTRIIRTAKITFFKNKIGNLNARIIPHNDDGGYPKSGWITCENIHPEIEAVVREKLNNNSEYEGYFTATYVIIARNENSPILSYKGKLLAIEAWEPPFIKDRKK